MASGDGHLSAEKLSVAGEGSDKDLERTLLKPAPSWTALVKQGISYYVSW